MSLHRNAVRQRRAVSTCSHRGEIASGSSTRIVLALFNVPATSTRCLNIRWQSLCFNLVVDKLNSHQHTLFPRTSFTRSEIFARQLTEAVQQQIAFCSACRRQVLREQDVDRR